MYAPYVPHIAETLYQKVYRYTFGIPSLHQTRFDVVQQVFINKENKQLAESMIAIVAQVRKLKSDRQLSLKTPLNNLTIGVETKEVGENLRKYDQIIKGVTQALAIDYLITNQVEPTIQDDNGILSATVWGGQ